MARGSRRAIKWGAWLLTALLVLQIGASSAASVYRPNNDLGLDEDVELGILNNDHPAASGDLGNNVQESESNSRDEGGPPLPPPPGYDGHEIGENRPLIMAPPRNAPNTAVKFTGASAFIQDAGATIARVLDNDEQRGHMALESINGTVLDALDYIWVKSDALREAVIPVERENGGEGRRQFASWVAVDDSKKAIIVHFRGPKLVNITDLAIALQDQGENEVNFRLPESMRVQPGTMDMSGRDLPAVPLVSRTIFQAWRALADSVYANIQSLKQKHPDYAVVVMGHEQGADVGTLATISLEAAGIRTVLVTSGNIGACGIKMMDWVEAERLRYFNIDSPTRLTQRMARALEHLGDIQSSSLRMRPFKPLKIVWVIEQKEVEDDVGEEGNPPAYEAGNPPAGSGSDSDGDSDRGSGSGSDAVVDRPRVALVTIIDNHADPLMANLAACRNPTRGQGQSEQQWVGNSKAETLRMWPLSPGMLEEGSGLYEWDRSSFHPRRRRYRHLMLATLITCIFAPSMITFVVKSNAGPPI